MMDTKRGTPARIEHEKTATYAGSTMPPRDEGTKMCSTCGGIWPETPEYFDRDNKSDSGFRATCKVCRAEASKKKANEKVLERVDNLEKGTLQLLAQLQAGGSDVPHQAELFQRLMECFGGVGGFAQHWMAHYLMTKAGSSVRSKMLEMMVRMAAKVSEQQMADINLMADEDLQREIERRAKRLLLEPRPGIHGNGHSYDDGSPESTP